MRNNQRGAVEIAVVVAIAAATFLFGAITSGSKFNPLKLFQSDSAANKKAEWTRWDEKIAPKLIVDKDGKAFAVGTEINRSYDTGKENVKPRATYSEQVAGFFAKLTNLGLFAVVFLLIFFPGILSAFAITRWRAWRGLAKTIVAGVKAAPDEAADAVKTEIAIKQNESQKKMVSQLKGELQ